MIDEGGLRIVSKYFLVLQHPLSTRFDIIESLYIRSIMIKRLILLSALILIAAPAYYGQAVETESANDELALQKLWLISDLQTLEAKIQTLDSPLARARAKAEVADAAWSLDREWAKKLLNEAYTLTLPDEAEQIRLRNIQVGTPPAPPTSDERARSEARNRVMMIAGRDKDFANQLAKYGADKLGKYEEHLRYATLAAQAVREGDKKAAIQYILQSIEADPTQITAGRVILDLAAKDRTAADALTIQYIERLRMTPVSLTNQSLGRTFVVLYQLVFLNSANAPQTKGVSVNPAVMKAYLSYIIDVLRQLGQTSPNSLKQAGGMLQTIWPLINQYAPELALSFLELERLYRASGGDTSLSQPGGEDARASDYERGMQKAVDSSSPDATMINLALSRGDFDKARKLIGKLSDGTLKVQLTELADAREAMSLAAKGDILEARILAERLRSGVLILQVYPVILSKCAASKDQSCATALVYQAMKQLKRADSETIASMPSLPLAVIPTSHELDPISLSLSKLAKAVAPINEPLALEVLDEMVLVANRSNVDTGFGRSAFEVDVFKRLAPIDENRVRQIATNLSDPFRRIVALAAIYQWKVEELNKTEVKR